MMRQAVYRKSEFKKKYDPDTGKHTRQRIWSGERSIFGEGISDKVRSFGTKVFGKKAVQRKVTFAPQKPDISKKAVDKIVKMLSEIKPPAPSKKKVTFTSTPKNMGKRQMTQQDINNRVLQIMSGGKIAPQANRSVNRKII